MTTNDRDQEIRQQVEAASLSYCRGIDRLDPDAVLAAFHPGAMLIDYGPEPTTIEAFTERVIPSLRSRYRATQHRITNLVVDVDESTGTEDSAENGGPAVIAEAYILAFHVQPPDGAESVGAEGPGAETAVGDRLVTFNGRYIDRYTEHDGQWRISERHLRCDWSRIEVIEETMGNRWAYSGRGGTDDPLTR